MFAALAAGGVTCGFIVVGELVRSKSEPSALLSLVTVIVALAAVLVRSERGRVAAARGHAVAEERLRIAGDLHDLVGHGLSTIAVQSSTARVAIDAGDEQAARAALTAVESTSRTAMREMRQLLAVLRDRPANGSERDAPAPGLTDIATLVNNVRAGGVAVTADLPAGTARVPAAVQLCAYRVVQEALTNAVKHAPGAIVTVQVTAAEGVLRVVVDSSGGTRPQREAEGSGLGLAGIRARVAAAGGQSSIGATANGWRVDAQLPLHPAGMP
jgi:signal transduction histidine kinase